MPVLMQGYAGLGAKSGTLEADGRATVRTQKEQNVFGWKGNASLASLDLTNAKGTSLMSWGLVNFSLSNDQLNRIRRFDIHACQCGLGPAHETRAFSFSNLMQGYAGLGAKSGTLEADGRATVRTQKEQNSSRYFREPFVTVA